jgi:hypothetical protein
MACRSPCGPRSGASGTAAKAVCTTRRTTRGSIAPPRAPTKTSTTPGAASRGRTSSQASQCPFGGLSDRGAALLVALADHMQQATLRIHAVRGSSAHNSATRNPEEYNTSIMARSRRAMRLRPGSHPPPRPPTPGTRTPLRPHRDPTSAAASGIRPRRLQCAGRVGGGLAAGLRPPEEHACGRGPARHGRALRTTTVQVGQPRAQQPVVHLLPGTDAMTWPPSPQGHRGPRRRPAGCAPTGSAPSAGAPPMPSPADSPASPRLSANPRLLIVPGSARAAAAPCRQRARMVAGCPAPCHARSPAMPITD